MATPTMAPIVVQTTSGAVQPSQVAQWSELKRCAAAIVRGEASSERLEEAGRGLLQGIREIEMRNRFRFMEETASDATLVQDQAAYALTNDYFSAYGVQLVDASTTEERGWLDYVPWARLQHEQQNQQDWEGTPRLWSAKNPFDDGEILVGPRPDAAAASDLKLRISYYSPITKPSADTDVIDAPETLMVPLCTYGEFWMLKAFGPRGEWQAHYRLFRDQLAAFRASDRTVAKAGSRSIIPVDSRREGTRLGQRRVRWVKS